MEEIDDRNRRSSVAADPTAESSLADSKNLARFFSPTSA